MAMCSLRGHPVPLAWTSGLKPLWPSPCWALRCLFPRSCLSFSGTNSVPDPSIPNGSDPVGLFSFQWGRPTGEMGGDGGCQVGTEGPWRAGLSREAALEPGFYDAENFTSGR